MKRFFGPILAVLAAFLLAIPVPAQPGKAVTGLKTVIIDAGHGGHDAGCISADKKVYEKNITLDIAKRLAGKISAEYPDVTVKMTRTQDRFIQLQDRGKFANDAGGDLFISIHVNSTDRGTSANGYSVHCLGKSANKNRDIFNENLNLVKRENSVVKLEKDYQTTYAGFDPDNAESSIIFTLMQNAHLTNSLDFASLVLDKMSGGPIKNSRGVSQDPFLVLARAAMPAVLIEVGFITNPKDLAVMRTDVGRDGIADNIFNAFCAYKKHIDDSVKAKEEEPAKVEQTPAPKQEDKKPEPKVEEKAPAVLFGVQVLATAKVMDPKDPFFGGYTPVVVQSGKLYKYIIGTAQTAREVKKNFYKFQAKYPDCYIVKIENGATSPVR